MRPEDLKVAIALIGLANPKDKEHFLKWERQRVLVKRGELITSYSHLAEICGLSVQNVRTSIKNLTQDGFVEIVKPNTTLTNHSKFHFTHLKICKYETYQKAKPKLKQANSKNLTQRQRNTNTKPNTTPHSKLTTTEEIRSKEDKNTLPKGRGAAKPRTTTETPPEILVFREITGRYPKKELYPLVIDSVRKTTKEKMAQAHNEWLARGYNGNSIKWLTEWAVNGIPESYKQIKRRADSPLSTSFQAEFKDGKF